MILSFSQKTKSGSSLNLNFFKELEQPVVFKIKWLHNTGYNIHVLKYNLMTTTSLLHPLRWEKVYKKQSLSFPWTLFAIEFIHFINHTFQPNPTREHPNLQTTWIFMCITKLHGTKKSMAAHRFRLLLPHTFLVETTLIWDKIFIILRSCSKIQHSHSLQTFNKVASYALPILAHKTFNSPFFSLATLIYHFKNLSFQSSYKNFPTKACSYKLATNANKSPKLQNAHCLLLCHFLF